MPYSEGGGSDYSIDREFQHVGLRVWQSEDHELYYAISVACVDYDPNLPKFSFDYKFDIATGGELRFDGKKIEYSPNKRLLALNPFGEMEELLLTPIEADIVSQGDANQVWENVVLKRIYRRNGSYSQGKRTGRWTYKDAQGRIAFDGEYVNGRRDGKWTYYYPSGKVRAEANYVSGGRDGLWTYFDQNGKVKRTIKWNKDNPVDGPVQQAGLGYSEARNPNGSVSSSSY